MRCRSLVLCAVVGVAWASGWSPARGQVAPAGEKPVTMDFPADGVEIRTLVDIVTKRLKIPILYDETINNKKVVIRVPVDVPESALMGILNSALRMKQLALVDSDQPGWKQIVPATNLAAVAQPANAPGLAAGSPVIHVINLKQAETGRVVEAVRPFLTPTAGQIQAVTGQKTIVVTDYPSVVAKVEQVVKTLDEGTPVEVKFVPIKNAEPSAVAQTVQQILASKEGVPGAAGGGAGAAAQGIVVTPDDRAGQVVVIAPKNRVPEVMELIAGIDKPLDLATKVYRLKVISPDRVDRLVKGLIGPAAAKRAYQSSVDKDSQSLVVSASDDVHKRIDALLKELDQPVAEGQSPLKFYKLKNTKAADVLATISALMGEQASVVTPAGATGSGDNGYGRSLLGPPDAGDSRLPLRPGAATGGVGNAGVAPLAGADPVLNPASPMARPRPDDLGPLSAIGGGMTPRGQGGTAALGANAAAGDGDDGSALGKAKSATVTADVNTNSVIVIAPPAVQALYAGLIAKLDERRPQVQIECTVVTLDTSDDFSLGVDIAKLGGFGDSRLIALSSFGISRVDPVTGRLTPINQQGGTVAVLSPGIANIVIRALQQNSRARLVSAPQLLVNDNGKGKLQSVSQEPFAEILDTSTTQSRTGLGGLAQAGTTISVEPHISEDDYLQLTYSIELSSFTGTGRSGLPPPSQKNSVDSTVTVPDGNTIVVGGLRVKNFREARDTIPFADLLPYGDWIFGSRTKNTTDQTLFVFIKPVILRDDKFEDLKFLSGRVMEEVKLPGDSPESKPIPLK